MDRFKLNSFNNKCRQNKPQTSQNDRFNTSEREEKKGEMSHHIGHTFIKCMNE